MGGKRVTTESYLQDVRIIHAGKEYEYKEEWEYTGSRCPIEIRCPKHGWWNTKAYSHRNMESGCPKCAQEYKDKLAGASKRERLAREYNKASQRQRERDDYYSIKVAKLYGDSVTIISECLPEKCYLLLRCREHGHNYYRDPARLRARGCVYCIEEVVNENAQTFRNNLEDVISKFVEIHGDQYDYSEVDYCNTNTKVKVICKEHGPFWISPANHINSQSGCYKCGLIKQSEKTSRPKEDWISLFKDYHGDLYDYSNVDCVRSTQKIPVICREHGVFQILPARHYRGWGCPICVPQCSGFRVEMPAKVYYLRITCPTSGKIYYKIGVTNKGKVENRFPKSNIPYYTVLVVWSYSEGYTAIDRESLILRKYKDYVTRDDLPFWKGRGHSEIFDKDVLSYDKLL